MQKKQGEYIQNDVRNLSIHMDVDAPFRDVKDAITRLLPFHVSLLQLTHHILERMMLSSAAFKGDIACCSLYVPAALLQAPQ